MSGLMALGLACGLGIGLGLWALLSLVPSLGRPRLTSRVAPYVQDVSADARAIVTRRPSDPLPVLGVIVAPLVDLVERVAGGSDAVARRLRQAGSGMTVPDFRSRQLVFAAIGAGAGVLIAIGAGRAQAVPFVAQSGIVIPFAVGGFVLRDYLLQRVAKARLARMASELPTVLEFLTLSLSAGEGVVDAVRRIARISRGELARELSLVVSEVATGVPFAESLTATAAALDLAPFSRFVEQLTVALERGTPLAEVLRASAGLPRPGEARAHRVGGAQGGCDARAPRFLDFAHDRCVRDLPRHHGAADGVLGKRNASIASRRSYGHDNRAQPR